MNPADVVTASQRAPRRRRRVIVGRERVTNLGRTRVLEYGQAKVTFSNTIVIDYPVEHHTVERSTAR